MSLQAARCRFLHLKYIHFMNETMAKSNHATNACRNQFSRRYANSDWTKLACRFIHNTGTVRYTILLRFKLILNVICSNKILFNMFENSLLSVSFFMKVRREETIMDVFDRNAKKIQRERAAQVIKCC